MGTAQPIRNEKELEAFRKDYIDTEAYQCIVAVVLLLFKIILSKCF